MKDETKLKFKKAAKIGGLIAGFLAVFILGMGFGSCSEKRVQQANAEAPNYGANYNLLDDSAYYSGLAFQLNATPKWEISAPADYKETRALVPLQNGEYLFTFDVRHMYGFAALVDDYFIDTMVAVKNMGYPNTSYIEPAHGELLNTGGSLVDSKGFYSFTIDESTTHRNFVVCGYLTGQTLDLAVISAANYTPMELGENWLPYAWISKRGTGNLGMVANTFTAVDVQNTLLRVQISDAYFFVGDGLICKGVNAYFRPLWNGAKYVNESNEIITYSYSESNEFVPYVCNYIEYVTLSGTPFRVAEYGVNLSSDGSQVAIVPQLQWRSDVYRSIYWLKVPEGDYVVGVDISTDVGAHWSYWSGTPNYKGITFFDYWRLSVADVGNAGFGSVGDSNIFSLISNGFSAVLPILNVQILPFLTLGMLLFAPLVIILIFAILKVLNK